MGQNKLSNVEYNSCVETTKKPATVENHPKVSHEPTTTTTLTQQSPQPGYIGMNSDNGTTPTNTHPQNQIWQSPPIATQQQQSSPKPHPFNNKQTMQEQEQNRVVSQSTSQSSQGAPSTTNEKGQTNNSKKQSPSSRVDKADSTTTRDQNQNNNGTTTTTPVEKPSVGSEEWHRLRRENHKQVERRRRETINEGINEIAKMIPGNEKNKGQILHRAAVYIRTLKEQQAEQLEKWTLEKLITEQAVNELGRQVETLKAELDQSQKENEELKRRLSGLDQQPLERTSKRLRQTSPKLSTATSASSSN
ncbi:hypothetical protein BDA99DRAFT_517328 [Phascolomyces articulosus]|uniref:BHLH domain-containing protein n=1 Tax=Phascolomyces articulosus TaxID=60185 RepID=A0AAD5PBD3_9FUNG|nr:hypothetical protein BDA99DRAFT_517328 [Phascolomyces articulosus]